MNSKKEKVGIVTLYGNVNFGNRLQNYAVQEIIKNYGYQPVTLVGIKNPFKVFLKDVIVLIKALFGDKKSRKAMKISAFNNKYIQKRHVAIKNGNFDRNLDSHYSYFVVGSDQVWNPEIRKGERKIFFLDFTKPYKKVCVSPSISVNNIDNALAELYTKELLSFPVLTCRENEGASLIEKLTGKKCTATIDPTLALDYNFWRKFEKAMKVNTKYILMFFLGEVNEELADKIVCFAKRKNMIIINPMSYRDKYSTIDPREFVWLIDNAEIVFTDSFHGLAFAINLKKPVYVFDRISKINIANHINSRIVSLIDKFQLYNQYIKDVSNLEISNVCDFKCADEILSKERLIFFGELDKTFNNKQ